jgi:uncharacterized protein (DUF2237 family)
MGETDQNVLGLPLEPCSTDPLTGYARDGHCRHRRADPFSREQGNDLTTPAPAYDFPGLAAGDRWCLCLGRWIEALDADVAPPVVLEATAEAVGEHVPFSTLLEHEHEAA